MTQRLINVTKTQEKKVYKYSSNLILQHIFKLQHYFIQSFIFCSERRHSIRHGATYD
jgi:hypothetical protein